MTVVLGLDPGTRHFGWGVVERRGTRLIHVAHGIAHTDGSAAIATRLVVIEAALVEALDDHDDVQNVYADFDISDEELAALEGAG